MIHEHLHRAASRPGRTWSALASLFVTLAALPAQQPGADVLPKFLRKPVREQQRLLDEIERAVVPLLGDHGEALRALAAASREPTAQRASQLRARKPGKRPPKLAADSGWQLPRTVAYAFGRGVIAPVSEKKAEREHAELRVPVELALTGMAPGTDLAVAELERRLDADQAADDFAAFLESWRNGDESFYEALDRTAGTQASVFFYDVMLADFVGEIAGDDPDARELATSLNAAHDALHRAFLCYRQYRAFREAVALALVLPPDVPLPARLRRYEEPVAGSYSLRQQVLMVLAASGYDPRVVVERVRAAASPLPRPLWRTAYEPAIGWQAVFRDAMPAMIEAAGDTDAFLARATAERRAQAESLAAAARAVLVPAAHDSH